MIGPCTKKYDMSKAFIEDQLYTVESGRELHARYQDPSGICFNQRSLTLGYISDHNVGISSPPRLCNELLGPYLMRQETLNVSSVPLKSTSSITLCS